MRLLSGFLANPSSLQEATACHTDSFTNLIYMPTNEHTNQLAGYLSTDLQHLDRGLPITPYPPAIKHVWATLWDWLNSKLTGAVFTLCGNAIVMNFVVRRNA